MKKIRQYFEYWIFLLVYKLLKLLPFKMSSNFMGWLFKLVGPLLPVTKIAIKNINMAFPNIQSTRRKYIISKMWENLGRVVGEFPHTMMLSDVEISAISKVHNQEILINLKKQRKPAILLTGHYGNWENGLRKAKQLGLDLAVIYRKINNSNIDKVICQERERINIEQIAKSTQGVKQIINAMKNNKVICILADQKENTGISSKFFGISAMTGTLPVKLAIKSGIALIPAMSVRNLSNPTTYDIFIDQPISISKKDDIASVTQKINDMYQSWIMKHPEQWFWVHKRWPKELYK